MENLDNIYLRPYVKHGDHCTDIHETHYWQTTFRGDLYRISPKSAQKYGNSCLLEYILEGAPTPKFSKIRQGQGHFNNVIYQACGGAVLGPWTCWSTR